MLLDIKCQLKSVEKQLILTRLTEAYFQVQMAIFPQLFSKVEASYHAERKAKLFQVQTNLIYAVFDV
jgi:hypothetical protein